jgi:hypothetical protein
MLDAGRRAGFLSIIPSDERTLPFILGFIDTQHATIGE